MFPHPDAPESAGKRERCIVHGSSHALQSNPQKGNPLFSNSRYDAFRFRLQVNSKGFKKSNTLGNTLIYSRNFLKRTTQIQKVSSLQQLPPLASILNLSRERILHLQFESKIKEQRETIGEDFKSKLDGFLVSVHTIEPIIRIAKLITDQEVEGNQIFFEKYARDYGKLGEELIFQLASYTGVTIDPNFPLDSFSNMKSNSKQTGRLNDWNYYLHGIHCGFVNRITGQNIEVSLVCGPNFGDLDPYFFSRFIKKTPSYNPLPVEIYEDFADGFRIINKMLSLGRFRRSWSDVYSNYCTVVVETEIE